MGRRKSRSAWDIIEFGALIPAWATLSLAVASFFLFAYLAGLEVPSPADSAGPGKIVPWMILTTVSGFAQYIVPALIATGAVVGLARHWSRSKMLDRVVRSNRKQSVESLSWRQFEEVCHEMFRRKGYTVIGTRDGPDGGIDLRIRRDGEEAIVQCKHWRKRKVGVNIVREQLGIMTADNATRGYVVTSGKFTTEAIAFAKGKPITLVDGANLGRWLGAEGPESTRIEPQLHTTPSCPVCSADMVERVARRGPNEGSAFWGCSRFPVCRGTRPLS